MQAGKGAHLSLSLPWRATAPAVQLSTCTGSISHEGRCDTHKEATCLLHRVSGCPAKQGQASCRDSASKSLGG